ncbi:MAG: ECF transporter S component [Candidatus Bathyarchaeia archaeon]
MTELRILKVCVISILVALCVATNYALIGVYNVKVMDFLVFVGGFCFGPIAGALIGVLSWAVYGVLNPYGFVPQIWLATMFCESIYGVIGGLLGRNLTSNRFDAQRLQLSVLFGVVGFMLTLIYDIILNVVWALVFEMSAIGAIVVAVPFTLVHELSNVTIFGLGSLPTITAVEKIMGVGKVGVSQK